MIHKPKGPTNISEPPKIQEVSMIEGIRRTSQTALTMNQRPLFIGVFGFPNSGKSYLISKTIDNLYRDGISCTGFHCSVSSSTIRHIANQMKKGDGSLLGAYLFHCAFYRSNLLSDDQESMLKLIAGKGMDIAIGIYNPRFSPIPEGNYNIIISNSDSRKKS